MTNVGGMDLLVIILPLIVCLLILDTLCQHVIQIQSIDHPQGDIFAENLIQSQQF